MTDTGSVGDIMAPNKRATGKVSSREYDSFPPTRTIPPTKKVVMATPGDRQDQDQT